MTPAAAASATLPGRRQLGAVARSLFQLTKPRIIELLLVTTIPTMLLAQRGLPSLRVFAVTLIGGTLAAASANTLNCYLDRDIDAVMRRTAHRPLVAKAGRGSVKPGEALASGIVLGAAATLLLGLVVNWLAAFLAAGAILFYVFVYTLGLKRRTASNIVIGGAAGCFPGAGRLGRRHRHRRLAGRGAVRGDLPVDAAALLGAGHAIPRRLRGGRRADAAGGGDPAGRGPHRSLLLRDGGGHARPRPLRGVDYAVCAAGLGGWFLTEAHRLDRQARSGSASAPRPALQARALRCGCSTCRSPT